MSVKANIVIDQGADWSTSITVTSETDGSVTNLTGYTANGHVRKHYSSSTAYVFDCSFAADKSTGVLTIALPRSTTKDMEAGRYVYDVELTNSANTRIRLVEGIATVTPQVTKT